MSLTIVDRLKAVLRVIRIAADPKVDYVNLMWQAKSNVALEGASAYDHDDKKAIYTHTFFMGSESPVKPLLAYMAQVAARSETLEDLNVRCEYYLNKVAVAHMKLHPNSDIELQYVAQPIRNFKASTMEEN